MSDEIALKTLIPMLRDYLVAADKDRDALKKAIAEMQKCSGAMEVQIAEMRTYNELSKTACIERGARCEKIHNEQAAEIKDLSNRVPNEREVQAAVDEKKAQKKKVSKISDKIVWLAGGGAGILFVLGILKHFKVI